MIRSRSSPDPPSAARSPSEPTRHPSQALKLLVSRLESRPRSRVLDLGPAVGRNVAFLAGFSCKLFIADLHQTLFPRSPAAAAPTPLATRLARDLPAIEGGPMDAILAWDLLNYLEPGEIEVLGRELRRYCRFGTILLTMISTLKEMPGRARSFEIADRESLVYGDAGRVSRLSPRYKEPDLGRLLADFKVETTYLLRNGMQEYVLEYRPVSNDWPAAGQESG